MSQLNSPLLPQGNAYGRDLGTFPNADANGAIDLDLGMAEVTGRDLLAQSLVRRQTTPRGSVIDCPNDCLDVRGWLSEGVTPAQLNALVAPLRGELLKDERVTGVRLTVSYQPSGGVPGTGTLTIVEDVTSGYGPFRLTLTVSQVTVGALMENVS